MAKQRQHKKQESYVTYIVSVASYSADYSYSIGHKDGYDYLDSKPYDEYLSLEIRGELKITDSRKAKVGTPINIVIQSDNRGAPDKDFRPQSVGWLDTFDHEIRGVVFLPPQSVHHVLLILKTG